VKLKRVEIKGFKSIAKRTVISFSRDVTCIAGPNGCGKSNIIDGIRWALGEQSVRSLRGGAMTDVIFSGTQETSPSSMASVTLEFERDGHFFPKTLEGFNELSISRRLYRTGESAYFLNNVKCRLKDITDIFLDTGLDRHGYAIIEQGKIKDIIQSKPEDIRYLIEEAAEVGKFKVKRIEAMKRLEAASVNLDRIKDLLSEVSGQRDSLRSQAKKAKRYQTLRSGINELTMKLWSYEIKTVSEMRQDLERQSHDLSEEILSHEKRRQGLVDQRQSHEQAVNVMKNRLDSLDASIKAAEARSMVVDGSLEAGQQRVKDNKDTRATLSRRIEQAEISIRDALVSIEEGSGELSGLADEIKSLEDELEKHNIHIQHLSNDYTELDKAYDDHRARLFDDIGHSRAGQQRLSSIKARRDEVMVNIKNRENDLVNMEDKARAYAGEVSLMDRDISTKGAALRALEDSKENLAKDIRIRKAGIDEKQQRVIVMEKTITELSAKISMLERIINVGKGRPKEDATDNNGKKKASDALVVHSGYEDVVGRSMGCSLDYMIIEDHEEALSIEEMDKRYPGYIPVQPYIGASHDKQMPEGEGVIGPLSRFVDGKQGYEGIATALSQGICVVEGIKDALDLWKQGQRSCSLVTKDGIILDPTGVIRTTADMAKYAEGLKAKAEKAELTVQMGMAENDLQDLKASLEETRSCLDGQNQLRKDIDKDLAKAQKELDLLSLRSREISRDKDRLAESVTAYNNDIIQWRALAARLKKDCTELESGQVLLDEQISKGQEGVKTIDEKRKAAREVLQEARDSVKSRNNTLNELRVVYAKKNERIQWVDDQLKKKTHEMKADKDNMDELLRTEQGIQKDIARAAEEKAGLVKEIDDLRAAHAGLLPEFRKITDEVLLIEGKINEERDCTDTLEKSRNEALLRLKEHDIAYTMRTERMNSRFGKDIVEVEDAFDPDVAREKIARYEIKIERMGQINFTSIDAFENVQARWEELHRQYEDIVQAGMRMKELIAGIEKQSSKAFMETFVRVKSYFQEIFTTMFGGGKADIVLLENNPMEAGVEIVACPPFKRQKAMSLLSEGEKTLCATCFIFALFKVRPSPFCIMDEVDAPLDDANVDRFNRLIRAFSDELQFIVVTHNRHTMEMADIIYGVTFDVPGISRVVSMVLKDENG